MQITANRKAIWRLQTQTLLIMKFTTVLLLAAFLQVSAKGVSQQVSLKFNHVSLIKVFSEIERQTGYSFIYGKKAIELSKPISIDISNLLLTDALKKVFQSQPFEFKIIDNYIVVSKKNETNLDDLLSLNESAKEPVEISGMVLNSETKLPLESASVMIAETHKAVLTDIDGNFSIHVLPGQSLIISYVGYKETTIKVGSNLEPLKIYLTPVLNQLKVVEIINTGYQRLPKERSAGSFSNVTKEEIMNKSASMNVVDRMEGLVPGLAVNYGSSNDKFLVRGLTSINASRTPLVVVDGVPILDYNSVQALVNPEDVESITVLRDATAASIWGAAAANGVIVITTKKGKMNSAYQKIKIKFNSFVTMKGRPDLNYYNMMDSKGYLATAQSVFSITNNPWANVISSSGAIPIVPPHERIQYDLARGLISQSTATAEFDSLSQYSNRGQINDYLTQPSVLFNNSLTFDGGSAFHSYYGSFAYVLDKSSNKTNLNRYQLNLHQDFKFSKNIRFDILTNISYQTVHKTLLPGLPYGNSNYTPYAMFADASGKHLSQAYLTRMPEFQLSSQTASGINLDYIPLDEPSNTQNNQANLTARINAGLNIKLSKSLNYEARAQYQRGTMNYYDYYNQSSYKVRNELVYFTQAPVAPSTSPTYYLPSTGGQYNTHDTIGSSWTVRNQFTYDKMWNGKHQITAIAGAEVRDNLVKVTSTQTRGYDYQTETSVLYNQASLASPGVSSPVNYLPGVTTNNTLISTPVTFTQTEQRFVSGYSNAAYTYNGKYSINSSIRFDQSNLFGTSTSLQYKPIWSVGGKWNISKESFFKIKCFDNLSLRATYGLAGNAPNPGFAGPYDIVSASSVAYFSGLGLGYTIIVPRNNEIKWESTATTNIGLDFAVFKNRITGSVDVYKKSTSNLLGYQPADPTSGWSYTYTNLGNMENKGIEIQINSLNISTKNFKWTTTFNISYNKNLITNLATAAPLTVSTKVNSSYVQGYSAYSVFAYNNKGLDGNGNPYAFKTNGTDTARLLADFTVNDILYKGSTQPLWYGGITNNFSYKGFSLSFLVIYNLGNSMRRDVNQMYTGRLGANIPVYFNNRWQNPGDELKTDVPKYIGNAALNSSRA